MSVCPVAVSENTRTPSLNTHCNQYGYNRAKRRLFLGNKHTNKTLHAARREPKAASRAKVYLDCAWLRRFCSRPWWYFWERGNCGQFRYVAWPSDLFRRPDHRNMYAVISKCPPTHKRVHTRARARTHAHTLEIIRLCSSRPAQPFNDWAFKNDIRQYWKIQCFEDYLYSWKQGYNILRIKLDKIPNKAMECKCYTDLLTS